MSGHVRVLQVIMCPVCHTFTCAPSTRRRSKIGAHPIGAKWVRSVEVFVHFSVNLYVYDVPNAIEQYLYRYSHI